MAKTAIEWTDYSWNPIKARSRVSGRVGWFCVHASPGCAGCYAERMNLRLGNGAPFKAQHAGDVEIYLDEKALMEPLRWRKPRTVFVCSMTDLFGDFVSDEMIDAAFAVMALRPEHTFIVLTKRVERLRRYIEAEPRARIYDKTEQFEGRGCYGTGQWPLPNVWLGASVEDQRRADERIPELLATPAALRFLSIEPLLESVKADLRVIDWVIVGGESGPRARAMHPDWAREIRDQCAAAGVPFFFKQWGEWSPTPPPGVRYENFSNQFPAWRVGKDAAGRKLDGRTHDERPPLAHQVGVSAEARTAAKDRA